PPVLVVTPATADLEVAPAVALLHEPGSTNQPDRTLVAWLDARLHTVQPQLSEGMVQHQLEPGPHVALAGERNERVVAEVCAPETPVEDLAETEVARELPVLGSQNDERSARRWDPRTDHLIEPFVGPRRMRPGPMQASAPGRRCDERIAVRWTQGPHDDLPPADAHRRSVRAKLVPTHGPDRAHRRRHRASRCPRRARPLYRGGEPRHQAPQRSATGTGGRAFRAAAGRRLREGLSP